MHHQDASAVKSRWPLVAVALLSATLFAISVWIGQWWTVGEVAVGPMGSRHCFNGDCRPAGLAWLNAGELWQRCAIATWVGCLVSMVLLLGVAGAYAANRTPKLIAKSTLTGLVTTALAGGYFIAKMPSAGDPQLQQGAYMFIAAIVLGFVAPIKALRSAKPRP